MNHGGTENTEKRNETQGFVNLSSALNSVSSVSPW
jgi:hypothetical protein